MIQSLLIANRGEIACRIARTARRCSSAVCSRKASWKRSVRLAWIQSPSWAGAWMRRSAASYPMSFAVRQTSSGIGSSSPAMP